LFSKTGFEVAAVFKLLWTRQKKAVCAFTQKVLSQKSYFFKKFSFRRPLLTLVPFLFCRKNAKLLSSCWFIIYLS